MPMATQSYPPSPPPRAPDALGRALTPETPSRRATPQAARPPRLCAGCAAVRHVMRKLLGQIR
jgi:hypothetical protein